MDEPQADSSHWDEERVQQLKDTLVSFVKKFIMSPQVENLQNNLIQSSKSTSSLVHTKDTDEAISKIQNSERGRQAINRLQAKTKDQSPQEEEGSDQSIEHVTKVIDSLDLINNLSSALTQLADAIQTGQFEAPFNTSLAAFIRAGASHLKQKLEENTEEDLTTAFEEGLKALDIELHPVMNTLKNESIKELKVRQQFNKIEKTWNSLNFIIIDDTKLDCEVLGDTAEIKECIDDTTQQLMYMTGSSFAKQLIDKFDRLHSAVEHLGNMINQWLKVQNGWIHFKSAFKDITPLRKEQIKQGFERLENVSRLFNNLIGVIKENPNCGNILKDQQRIQQNQEQLNTMMEDLEIIDKSVNAFFEEQQMLFPRAYFLSHDELYDLLFKPSIQAKNYLLYLFEGIAGIQIEDQKFIKGFYSDQDKDGDFVVLANEIEITADCLIWLSELETGMKENINLYIKKGLTDLATNQENIMEFLMETKKRKEYEEDKSKPPPTHIYQVADICLMVMWVSNSEHAIQEQQNNPKSLSDWLEKNNQFIKEIVMQMTEDLTKSDRIKLIAIVKGYTRNRDIIMSLKTEGINSVHDFKWIKYIKHYQDAENDCVIVRSINASLPYGYEYIGNCGRLVLTPLTDRFFTHFLSFYQQMYGSCGAGPAGTGKTETSKDLAKASGIRSIVTNCSDQLNYRSIASILAGLCQTGFWGVFDEFNRITPPVLSVIASQIESIRNARLQNMTRFLFPGREDSINLKPSYNLIITLNPGYAGRAQLPMNLKAQFRTFTLAVPDLMYIADNMLSSEGFVNSRELSKQMITTFKLCKEQMSKSSQYDFGLRSIKAILMQAGGVKRARPNASESLAIVSQMRIANLSRLLKEDVPIFESILAAVFPDIKVEGGEKGALWHSIESIIEDKLLAKDDLLVEKIIQIFTTVQIRHSIMILGPTGSGKSTCLEILADALALLRKNGHEDQTFQKVEIYHFNPKEFTTDQLYGYFSGSLKYKDGILSHYMRESSRRESKDDYSWIVMDGPMDANWVENMNTVMDDNKVLTLTSQERINLTFRSTVFFEIDNLRCVTPATVSRAGIIYVPIELNSWRHIVQTFIKTLSTQLKGFSDNIHFILQQKLDTPIEAGLRFLETNCEESQAFTDLQKVQQICNLFEVFVKDNTIWEHLQNLNDEIQSETLNNCIAWCYAWGLGGQINATNQGKFDQIVRQNFKMTGIQQNKTIFDYWLDITSNQFKPWSDQIQQFSFDSEESISQVIVPTEDTAKYGFFVENLTKIQKSLLFIGASGYGKTTVMTSKLKDLNEQFKTISMNLSIFSVAENFQKLLENNLMKKDELTLGVEQGKNLVVFVDNINMPQKDKFGTQSSSEFIKHLMDKKGLHIFDFDANKWHWKNVHEPTVVACYFGNPGGGINDIDPRIMRNFNTLRIPESSHQTMSKILSGLIGGILQTGFAQEVQNLKDQVVKSTIELFAKMKSEFIPSPLKFHYIFDLRDAIKVVKGMCMANASSVPNSQSFVKLWVNESSRVFQDKLLSFEDKKHFKKLVMEFVKENFEVQTNMEDLNNLRFGDMMNNENRYEQIPDFSELLNKMCGSLREYNQAQSMKMNLVLFEDAVDHILTISRILRQPNGHLIFVGLAGSGRQSLIRLSSYTRGIAFEKLDLSNSTGIETFNESIKGLMKSTGLQGKSTSFVLMDTQITDQKMLVILTELMNTADVPGLLNKNDQDEIRNGLQSIQIEKKTTGTSMNYYEVFKDRIQTNLHICVCFSPVGDTFRQTGRDLPQLLSQCSINWFLPWPDQALIAISQKLLKEQPQLSSEMIERVSQVSQQILASSNEASKQFLKRHKRYVYFTPKSYLDFLNLYKGMLTSKSIEIEREKSNLEKGVATLNACKEYISSLKSEQDQLLKDIATKNQKQQEAQKQTGLKCAETFKEIWRSNEQTSEQERVKNNLQIVMQEKKALLKQAQDEMENAERAIKQLDKDDILEILSYDQPPAGVRVVMECIMVILDEAKDWANIKKNLMDVKGFYHRLKKFDASITQEEEKLKSQGLQTPSDRIWARANDGYISKPNFDPSIFRKVSVAAYALSKWAVSCSEVRKIHIMVSEQKKENQIVINQLSSQIKQKELLNQQLDSQYKDLVVLGQNLDELVNEKKNTMQQFEEANKKLQKAQNLIDLLQDEGIRWVENAKEIQSKIDKLTGNIFLSSACLIFFGPFFDEYRESLLQQWNKACLEKRIPVEEEYNLVQYLGDPPTINKWAVQGLPTDMDSIEDGILTMKSARYPLCIDPQKQALKWIEQMHKSDSVSIKVNQAKWKDTVQMAISRGQALLVEDLEQDIDQYFNPLLDIRSKTNLQEQTTIQIGDKQVEFNPNFRLYMFTRMSNPHFNPEIQMKMTMVNFEVSLQGIQQQLLSDVVTIEKPEIEQQRDSLIKQTVEDKEKLTQLEEKVLKLLSESDGSILEDTQVLETLEQSKKTAKEISERIKDSKRIEAQINQTRGQYNSLAEVAGGLYFVVVDLEQINFQYKFSFEFLKAVFKASITESPQADEVLQRVSNIEFTFVKNIYSSICRGLFEKDKLTFSFMILVKIQFVKKIIEPDVWNILLKGPAVLSATEAQPSNPDPNYFTEVMWDIIYSLELKSSSKFKGITKHIKENLDDWKSWFKSENPLLMPLPGSQFEQKNDVLDNMETIQKQVEIKMIEVKKSKELIEILSNGIVEAKVEADAVSVQEQELASKSDANEPQKDQDIELSQVVKEIVQNKANELGLKDVSELVTKNWQEYQQLERQINSTIEQRIKRLDPKALKYESDLQLSKLIPIMERITEAVNWLEKTSPIQEFKDFKNPPPACVDVAKALLILLKGEKQNFSWENAQEMMSDPQQLILDFQAFDVENIDEWKLELLKPIMEKGLFFKEYLMDVSLTAANLCNWVNLVVMFNRAFKQNCQFRDLIKVTTTAQELDEKGGQQFKNQLHVDNQNKSELAIVIENVRLLNEKVATLEYELAEAESAQKQVENEVQLLKNQLTLADRLNNGQAGENERWRWKQNVLTLMDQRTIKSFDKLVLINSVRPELLKQSILSCLAQELGQYFGKPPAITSKDVWAALSKNNPLLIYDLPEANPNYRQVIDQLAAYKNFDLQKCCHYVCLGQGMEKVVLQIIQQSMDEGRWVVLSQCQSMVMFMKDVAMILGDKQRMDAAHEEFRLFIVLEPIPEQSNEQLPVSLVYGCVLMVTEPANGIKASLKRYWNSFDKARIDASNKTMRKLLFSLCYLHAIFWERNKFGPIGWNKSYTFTISDLIVTEKMLEQTIQRKEKIDKDSFDFTAEIIKINYAGQISDPLDLKLMETLANQICGFESLQDGFKYSQSGIYYNPPDGSAQSYSDYIETLPDIDAPELFYMHENVNIVLNKTISDRILQSFLGPDNQGTSVGESDDKSSLLKCQDILGKLPQELDQSKADKRLFTQDENGAIPALSMYLLQEIQRYNTCWKPVRSSLINLEKALKGQILMSADLESIQSQILNNQVPHQWKRVSYTTVFGLSRWIENFKERMQFMQKWIDEGNPKSFWISGFFLPEAFEVAVLQTEARNLKIPIDKLSLSFTIMPIENLEDVIETPKTGVYVHGLYIDGARWDRESNFIADQFPQKIIETMPLIHFKPEENYKRNPDEYAAPVFKTTQRLAMPAGAVQLVFYGVTIPSREPPSFWILRNVALLCMAE